MQVLEEENTLQTSLFDLLASQPCITIDVFPKGTEKTIPIAFAEGIDFKAICYYIKDKHDSFPTIKYIQNCKDIPSNTFLMITHESEMGYTVFFCLSYQIQKSSLVGTSRGMEIELEWLENNQCDTPLHALICVRSDKIQSAISQTMDSALKLAGGNGIIPEDKHPMPKWFSMLGWTSEIAFEKEVSEEDILNAVWSLRKNDVPLGYVIIEEGWQSTTKDLALLDFQADSKKFPEGLKGVVEKLHHTGVKHVGVWHSITGSRGGIAPDLAAKYQLQSGEEGRLTLGEDLGKTFHFFNDYYDYLRQQGIDFVQVGDQTAFERWPEYYKNLQTAIQAAAATHFSTSPLNNDCLRNENLFYWSNSPIARAAGTKNNGSSQEIKLSIRNNLTNALWLGHIMAPDVGSWSTSGLQNEMMAAFHAISGTINILHDFPGEHNKNLIRRSVLPSGKILQADHPLTLCSECIFIDPLESNQIYKAYTNTRQHGIIAVFNLSLENRTLRGTVSYSDIEGLQEGRYAVFGYHHGFEGLFSTGEEEELPISLKPDQYDILIFAPFLNGIAVWGFPSLYLASSPLLEIDVEEDSVHITSDVSGTLVLYCEKQILEIRRNGHVIPWEYDENSYILTIDPNANLVENHSAYSILFEA